jgi:hypothetical protein
MFHKCAKESCHTPSKTVPDDSDSVRRYGQNSEDIISSRNKLTAAVQMKDCKTVIEETLKDAVGNEGKFTGLILDGLPHGVGRMVYSCEI